MIKKIYKQGVIALFISIIGSTVYAESVYNFSEPNTPHLIQSIKNHQINMIQLGDSHTAADVMTGAVRQTLQEQLGDGGMGWGMPMYFTGQRLALYGYDHNNWQPLSSRIDRDENYTLGGLIARPQQDGAVLVVKHKQQQHNLANVVISVRQGAGDLPLQLIDGQGKQFSVATIKKNNTWEQVRLNGLQLPFRVTALHSPQTAIGGWWVVNQNAGGAIVSAVGINGAQLKNLSYWDPLWRNTLSDYQPDLVVLAYGTNEVYNKQNVSDEEQILIENITRIRQSVPRAAILIISTPEILVNSKGLCGTRPESLTAFQKMQKQVAQQQHTLYWDWQAAMGGSCQMKTWMKNGLALKDGIHFSAKGYEQLGQDLAHAILEMK